MNASENAEQKKKNNKNNAMSEQNSNIKATSDVKIWEQESQQRRKRGHT
jgi:hypothetical protein